jgi:hypothetical protein
LPPWVGVDNTRKQRLTNTERSVLAPGIGAHTLGHAPSDPNPGLLLLGLEVFAETLGRIGDQLLPVEKFLLAGPSLAAHCIVVTLGKKEIEKYWCCVM